LDAWGWSFGGGDGDERKGIKMIVGMGETWEGGTPSQSDIDYVVGLYASHGHPGHTAESYWVQKHAYDITSGAETREYTATDFAKYFAAEAAAKTVAEAAGVPSITDVVNGNGFKLPSFFTEEMIAGIPNWLLIGGGGVAAFMLMGKKG
jgi:hypothetical protein